MTRDAGSMSTHTFDKALEELWQCIEPWKDGYIDSRLTLVAVRAGDIWKVISGQLVGRIAAVQAPPRAVETPSAVALEVDLDGGVAAAMSCLDSLRTGKITADGRAFEFPIEGNLSGHFVLLNPLGLREGRRLSTVQIYGSRRGEFFDRTRLDWELKGAAPPMDGLSDLFGEVGLLLPEGDSCRFEAIMMNVIEVLPTSRVDGTRALVDVAASSRLRPDRMRLGYKVFHHRNLKLRDSCPGSQLTWEEGEQLLRGHFELKVPAGSVVQIFASYNGAIQQQFWIADPSALPNARRAAYGLFDKDLEVLQDYLFETSQARKNPQRDFEDGVASLLFILGFSPVNLGGITRLQEAPDGLCCTPAGDYAIVECTTGHPDRDDKLSKLFTRAQALRAALNRAGLHQTRLLPLMVTAFGRSDIPQSELDKAAQMKIAVVCREDLESALQRSVFGEAASSIYDAGVASLDTEPQLQFGLDS